MKRILCLLIVMSCLFQCFVFDVASASVTNAYNEKEILLLDALDIIDFDISNEDSLNAKVTRGEFAVSAAKSMGIAEEKEVSKTRYFKDVSPMDRSAGYIHALHERGIVKGNGMAEFKPNDNIRPKDAATIMLRVAGYDRIYTSETDFNTVIARNGLLSGFNGEYLTYGQMVSLIYKVLMMPSPTMTSISIDPKTNESTVSYVLDEKLSTVLYEYFGCYEVEGVLSATDGISINAETVNGDSVIIDDVMYDSNSSDAYSLLGYEVVAYVKEVKNGFHKIVFIADSGKNKVTEIELDNLNHVSSNLKLDYYEENSSKEKTLQLPANVTVIKNGTPITQNINEAFNGEQGKVVIIDNREGYVAKVFEYDSALVSAVHLADSIIYTKYGQSIDLGNGKLKRAKIYMADGNEIGIDAVQSGMFLTVFRSDECIEIYVSGNVVEGTVTSVSNDTVSVDGVKYEIEPSFVTKAKNDISVRTTGTFWFNIYNELAYYSSITGLVNNYGFLINAFTEEELGTTTLKMKIFTSGGKMLMADAVSKPRIDGERIKAELAETALIQAGNGVISQLVTYKLDAEGRISEIDTIAPNADGKGLFIRKGALGEVSMMRNYDTSSGAVMMLPDIVMKKGAPVFQVPKYEDAKSANDKMFKIVRTLSEDNDYDCIAYSSDNESFYTDALVLEREDDLTSFSHLDQPFMVVEVVDVIDAEENLRKELVLGGAISQKGGSDMGLMSFMVIEDYELTDADVEVDEAQDPYNQDPGVPVMPEDLGEGDIIRVVMNQDNEIVKIKQIFDFDNPNDSMLNIKKKESQTAGNGRFVAGYAVKKADNYVAMSTIAPNGPVTEFAYFHGSNVAPVIVMDETLRENRIYVGSYADVISYEETGSVASIVIPATFYGHARSFFVYRYGR